MALERSCGSQELLEVAVTISNYHRKVAQAYTCLLYTSDAADERSSVDLGGRRIIKKKKKTRKRLRRMLDKYISRLSIRASNNDGMK